MAMKVVHLDSSYEPNDHRYGHKLIETKHYKPSDTGCATHVLFESIVIY